MNQNFSSLGAPWPRNVRPKEMGVLGPSGAWMRLQEQPCPVLLLKGDTESAQVTSWKLHKQHCPSGGATAASQGQSRVLELFTFNLAEVIGS